MKQRFAQRSTRRKYLMSFDGRPNFRWVKMVDGKRHQVTCSELGLPPSLWTKEESYRAANWWWVRKIKEAYPDDWRSAHQEIRWAYWGRAGKASDWIRWRRRADENRRKLYWENQRKEKPAGEGG